MEKDIKALKWLEGSELGYDVWEKKYRFNNESFDEWLDRLSNGDEKVRKLIEEKKFLYGGRILANLNTGNGQGLSNCTTFSYVEDSLDDIMDTAKNLAISYKKEAGVGIALSKIRPKGASIGGNHKSDGIIGFLKIFNSVTENVKRGGARRGAMLVGLHCDHPDIFDFINIKKQNKGTDGEVTSANLSVLVTDEFMEHYIKGESYRKDFVVEATGEVIPHIVDTVAIMNAIVDTPKTAFEPGIIFVDRYKEGHLFGSVYGDKELMCNACHTYDSLLLTDKGYFKIGELAENHQTVNAWNGFEFSEVTPFKTSDSEKIYEVVFSDGSINRVTKYHKFHIGGTIKRTHELKIGDRLSKFNLPIIDCEPHYTKKQMYTQGFYAGDGTLSDNGGGKKYARITLCGEKVDLFDKLETISDSYKINKQGYMRCSVIPPSYDKLYVPINASVEEKIGFISGLLDSDGNAHSSARISSTNRQFLIDVKLMLSTIGVKCTVRFESDTEYRVFNGKKYLCNPIYTLTIPMIYSKKLIDLGLDCGRIELNNPLSKREISPCVVSITEMEGEQPVYCATEPKNHTLVVNGIMSGNCSEFYGAKGTVCLLGSINLSSYVVEDFGNTYFDFDEFSKDVKICIKALDKAHDYGIGKNGLKIQNDRAEQYRGIGLGIMGLADMFIKLGIRYGSKESVILSEKIAKIMRESSIEESIQLGKELGQPKGVLEDEKKLEAMGLPYIKGLRNNSLLSIAPAGSISLIANVSTGIEPVFRTSYVRKTESLNNTDTYYTVYHKAIQDVIDRFGYKPDYCIDTRDITVHEKVDVIAAWQKYVDLSISNTTNFKENATVEEIRELYRYGWEKGVKGLTVYVDGSIEGVLNDVGKKEETTELKRGEIAKKPDSLVGERVEINHGCGKYTLHIYKDTNTGKVFDCWINSKTNGCISNVQSLAVTISLLLRAGVDLDRISTAISGVGSCPSFMVGKSQGRCSEGKSCGTAIITALKKAQGNIKPEIKKVEKIETKYTLNQNKKIDNKYICPECGAILHPLGGCFSCECGFTKCE